MAKVARSFRNGKIAAIVADLAANGITTVKVEPDAAKTNGIILTVYPPFGSATKARDILDAHDDGSTPDAPDLKINWRPVIEGMALTALLMPIAAAWSARRFFCHEKPAGVPE